MKKYRKKGWLIQSVHWTLRHHALMILHKCATKSRLCTVWHPYAPFSHSNLCWQSHLFYCFFVCPWTWNFKKSRLVGGLLLMLLLLLEASCEQVTQFTPSLNAGHCPKKYLFGCWRLSCCQKRPTILVAIVATNSRKTTQFFDTFFVK